jgi:hypothetical protein
MRNTKIGTEIYIQSVDGEMLHPSTERALTVYLAAHSSWTVHANFVECKRG